MAHQGRLTKVMFALMTAMTVGSVVLLSLEGKPIKPMAFSLASERQSPLSSVHSVLGTQVGLDIARWQRIEITYRANAGQLSSEQGLTGSLALAYHFVISDGSGGQDGEIFVSHRWTKQLACVDPLQLPGGDNTIEICLIGDPGNPQCSPTQARRLERLARSLMRHCSNDLEILWN
jgi:hypothetical protein